MPFDIQTIERFFLVLMRLSVLIFMLPFFNSRIFPAMVKTGLSLLLSITLFPVVTMDLAGFPETLPELAAIVLVEFTIGLILGLLVQLVFEGIRLMGHLVGFETGFAIANVFDPQSGAQVSLMANFSYFTAMALFLLINGHHVLIHAMKESFEIIPLGSIIMDQRIFEEMLSVTGRMFLIAIKIGAPAIAALLFTKVGFGLITKLIPQMNIMIVGFPVQIAMGLFFFGICLDVLMSFMETYVSDLGLFLINIMGLMGD
ncbi:flagellar biosynthetic protein FliR [Desulfocicer niacini]